MLYRSWKLCVVGVLITGGLASQVQAGHWGPRHHHHHHGPGSTAAVAFAIGAVATMLSPPPPAPVIVHQHGFDPYGPPRPIYYPAPIVQREIIYRDQPAPIIVTPAQPVPQQIAPAPTSNGPSLRPVPDPSISVASTQPAIGTVVDRLPPMAARVNRGGVLYFEEQGVYYLPIQVGNESKFVVVQPQ